MINMQFDPFALHSAEQQWWNNWRFRAESKTVDAVGEFEDWLEDEARSEFVCSFDERIGKELKEWYAQQIFSRKCAYCERKVSGYPGDAEHYRPKNSVKQRTAQQSWKYPSVDIPNPKTGEIVHVRHPGYFWLAYDWRNLIPACALCNSGNGKNDRFEIRRTFCILRAFDDAEINALPEADRPRASRWSGYYYPTPAQLDLIEDPLLLYPMNNTKNRDSREHLRFGTRGIVVALEDSLYGQACIDVFHLDSKDLNEDRDTARRSFQSEYFDLCRAAEIPIEVGSKPDLFVEEFRKGRKPFPSAALDHFLLIRALVHQL